MGMFARVENVAEGGAADQQPASQPPSARSVVFCSLFTPTWSLGLLLFETFFLPFIRSCEGNPPDYPYQIAAELRDFSAGAVLSTYTWSAPFFVGLLVAIGALVLAATRQPNWARPLWWCYASVLVVNTLLTSLAEIESYRAGEAETNWKSILIGSWESMLIGSSVLLVPITAWLCKSPFNAAMWLQISLCLGSAAQISFFAAVGELLIGGKLAITASVFLILCSIVQRLDGHRCLVRESRRESSLQLSLRAALLLMSLGGMATAWVGGYMVAQRVAPTFNVTAVPAPAEPE
ncbi:MAG: hypothetical protein QGG36_00670 [Pirellulaceae bacterium]|nr:hypothetical protein [Pirellulaceae bacterium]